MAMTWGGNRQIDYSMKNLANARKLLILLIPLYTHYCPRSEPPGVRTKFGHSTCGIHPLQDAQDSQWSQLDILSCCGYTLFDQIVYRVSFTALEPQILACGPFPIKVLYVLGYIYARFDYYLNMAALHQAGLTIFATTKQLLICRCQTTNS